MPRHRTDPLALAACVLAMAMLLAYRGVMGSQGSAPLLWVQAILLAGAVLAALGASRARPNRVVLLAGAGALLCLLGLLALLSIGLPILLAGALCLVAAARARTGSGVP